MNKSSEMVSCGSAIEIWVESMCKELINKFRNSIESENIYFKLARVKIILKNL